MSPSENRIRDSLPIELVILTVGFIISAILFLAAFLY